MSKTSTTDKAKVKPERTADQVFDDWRYYQEFGGVNNDDLPARNHLEKLIQTTRKLFHEAFDRQVELVPPLSIAKTTPVSEPQSLKEILAQRQTPKNEPPADLPQPIDPTNLAFVNPSIDLQTKIAADERRQYGRALARAAELGLLAGLVLGLIFLLK